MSPFDDPCQKCAHDHHIRAGYSWVCKVICSGECPNCGSELDEESICPDCGVNWDAQLDEPDEPDYDEDRYSDWGMAGIPDDPTEGE